MAKQFEFKHFEKVRYSDCDMHQHLNHARYLSFMEQARVEYFKKLDFLPGRDWKSIPFIIVSAHCDYRAPAYLGDEVSIEIGVSTMGNTSFRFDYQLKEVKTGKLLAEGYTIQVMYDYEKMDPMPISTSFKKKIETLKKEAKTV